MANLSKIKRDELLAFIDKLKEQNKDDESIRSLNEIANALTEKKYGLVWEKHTEKVDVMLEHNIPVFEEVEKRKIKVDDSNEYNFLLEGDNLHSLKLLEKTHKGKIDVIYIDPPYNTGNKDFIYNDSYVDKADGYAHSKWLSFMSERLEIAKELLSDEGVIFISIDDKEQAQLKLLCDEVFGEENYVGHFVWIRKKKGSFLNKKIRKMTEYIVCYTANKGIKFYGEQAYSDKMQPIVKRTNSIKELVIKDHTIKTKLKDGEYKKGIYIKGNTGVEFLNDFTVKKGIVVEALKVRGRFVWSQDFLDDELLKGTIIELSSKFGFNVLRHNQVEKYKTPSSLISSENGVGTNEDASEELSKILKLELEDIFDYSKPSSLIKYLINFCKFDFNNSTILDFFAGSYVIIGTKVKSLINQGFKLFLRKKYI